MLRVVIACLFAVSLGLAFGAGIAADIKESRGGDEAPIYEPKLRLVLSAAPPAMPAGEPLILRPLQFGPSIEEALARRARQRSSRSEPTSILEPAAPPAAPALSEPPADPMPSEPLPLAPSLPPEDSAAEMPSLAPVPTPPKRASLALPSMPDASAIIPTPQKTPTNRRPLVAVVIDDLGYNESAAQRILAWDVPVTISILPYGRNLDDLVAQARASSHGVMLHLPMEPDGSEDPGPNPLLTTLSESELKVRIARNFSRFSGFEGVNNHMGSRFTRDERALRLVFEEIARRGLFFLDSFTTPGSIGMSLARQMGLPVLKRDLFLDQVQSRSAIAHQLRTLEALARAQGYAVAIGHPHEMTLDTIEKWLPHAKSRGIVFVTASGLLRELGSKDMALLPAPGS